MKNNLYVQLIFLVALLATLGSLYFSEVKNYIPCELCWYQRILMYPLIIISLISFIRNDYGSKWYIMTMSLLGIIISTYHYSLQKFPFMNENLNSCSDGSCVNIFVNWFGFITIPFMAFAAFLIVFILTLFITKEKYHE